MGNPLIAGSLVAGSLAEDHLGLVVLVYYHREVVAIGRAIAVRVQVRIAGDEAGNLHGRAKIYAATGAFAEEEVPSTRALIHPTNAHITRLLPDGNGREAVFYSWRRIGDI